MAAPTLATTGTTRATDVREFLTAVTLTVALVAGLVPAAAAQAPHTATVYAAASLSDVLEAQAEAFRTVHPFARIRFNFGGSNLLTQQILHGAPADAYVSADRHQMRLLEEAGKVDASRVRPLLSNQLVVIVPAADEGSVESVKDLNRFRRLIVADPEAVPAGVYARHWLEEAGLWEDLRERVVPALDVRAALSAVASGNLPAGIVYATDAATSDKVRVAYRVPLGDGPRIRYFAAPVGERPSHLVGIFLDFLTTPRASEIFVLHGFSPVTDRDQG